MGHEALKLELIGWLTGLEDQNTLEYLKVVKDYNINTYGWWYDLTSTQKEAINRGLKDIEEGRIVSHEEVKKSYGL